MAEITFEAKTQYMITRQSLAFTTEGLRLRASGDEKEEVPYSDISQVKFGRMRPILLLDAAITFSLAIPLSLAVNGPFKNWTGFSVIPILAIAVFTLAVALFLGHFFSSRYIFLEVLSRTRGRIGLTARESNAFGIPLSLTSSVVIFSHNADRPAEEPRPPALSFSTVSLSNQTCEDHRHESYPVGGHNCRRSGNP